MDYPWNNLRSVGANELDVGWRGVIVTWVDLVGRFRGELIRFPSQMDVTWVELLTCPEAQFPHWEDPPQRTAVGFRGGKGRTWCLPRAGQEVVH